MNRFHARVGFCMGSSSFLYVGLVDHLQSFRVWTIKLCWLFFGIKSLVDDLEIFFVWFWWRCKKVNNIVVGMNLDVLFTKLQAIRTCLVTCLCFVILLFCLYFIAILDLFVVSLAMILLWYLGAQAIAGTALHMCKFVVF